MRQVKIHLYFICTKLKCRPFLRGRSSNTSVLITLEKCRRILKCGLMERRRVVPLTNLNGGIYSYVCWSRWRNKGHFRIRSKWGLLNKMWAPNSISYVECQCRIWNISCAWSYDCNLQQIDSISSNPWTYGKCKSSLIENSNVRGVIRVVSVLFTMANYTIILYYSYGSNATRTCQSRISKGECIANRASHVGE